MPVKFNKVSILGVGLIGASIASAMKKRSLCKSISGYGRNEGNLKKALKRGLIDSYELSPIETCRGADLIVLATPVGRISGLAKEISKSIKKGALLIDVGSAKETIVKNIEPLLPFYVGCHPIAGSEKSGALNSRYDLFENRLCIIAKTPKTNANAYMMARGLWESLGARVVDMTPKQHDIIYALVSHFPHVAAYAMINSVWDIDNTCMEFAGSGFKDMTRIADSQPSLWSDICKHNKKNIENAIMVYIKHLKHMQRLLSEDDFDSLEAEFQNARGKRALIGKSNT